MIQETAEVTSIFFGNKVTDRKKRIDDLTLKKEN